MGLSVGFLVASTSTKASNCFAAVGVSYFSILVIFLVTGPQGFGDGLADSINLSHVTTSLHSDMMSMPAKHSLPSGRTGSSGLYCSERGAAISRGLSFTLIRCRPVGSAPQQ